MTNEKLFREIVDKCGLKLQYLAEKMGISYQSLLNKLHGKTEFTVYEVSVFQQITGCSDERKRTRPLPHDNAIQQRLDLQGRKRYVCGWAAIVKDGFLTESRSMQHLVMYVRTMGDTAVEVQVGSKDERRRLTTRTDNNNLAWNDTTGLGGAKIVAHMDSAGTGVDSLVLRCNYSGVPMEMHFLPAQ